MPKHKSRLSEKVISEQRATGKPTKLTDGGGLYLHLTPAGSQIWRLKFRWNNREQTLTFGHHPQVSIAQARIKRNEAKNLLRQNLDPRKHHGVRPIHTDRSIQIDLDPNWEPGKPTLESMKRLLSHDKGPAVERFFEASKGAIVLYRAHSTATAGATGARTSAVSTAKTQQRYYDSLNNAISKFSDAAEAVLHKLDEAPFEARRAARSAGTELHTLGNKVVSVLQALNEIEPSKSREAVELPAAINSLAKNFRDAFETDPVVTAPSIRKYNRRRLSAERSFVALCAILLNRSEDTIYRAARRALPASIR